MGTVAVGINKYIFTAMLILAVKTSLLFFLWRVGADSISEIFPEYQWFVEKGLLVLIGVPYSFFVLKPFFEAVERNKKVKKAKDPQDNN